MNHCLLEPCPLNPDSDPVFFVNPAPETYLGVGFIAIFGSQLEDNFFEHSLEDLMVGAGGLLKLKPVPFALCLLNPDSDPVFLVNPTPSKGFYCNIWPPSVA